ncbi:MAG: hypothetical protein ACWGNV_02315 [Bacteroidales bacterium]
MVKQITYILLLLGMSVMGLAQKGISVDLQAWANVRLATSHSGGDAGWNGSGISVGVQKLMENNFQAMASGEIGAAGIGNYLAAMAGIGRPIGLGSTRWVYTPGLQLLQGMTLSRPRPLYMWGLEQFNAIDFKLKKSSGPGLVLGFRCYGFPGYSEFSNINTFFDLRAGVRYTF